MKADFWREKTLEEWRQDYIKNREIFDSLKEEEKSLHQKQILAYETMNLAEKAYTVTLVEQAIKDGKILKDCQHSSFRPGVGKYGRSNGICDQCKASLEFYEVGVDGKRYILSDKEYSFVRQLEWSLRVEVRKAMKK